jgi:hypothetical protein
MHGYGFRSRESSCREVPGNLATATHSGLEKDLSAWRAPTRAEYVKLKGEFDGADATGRKQLRDRFADGDESFRDAVANARRGNQGAHFYLWRIALAFTAFAEPLPPLLQEYMAVNAPAFKRLQGRQERLNPTPHEATGIAGIVALLVRHGFRPYRHRGSQSNAPTAYSIVVDALRQVGVTKTEAAVEKIYEQHPQLREVWAEWAKEIIREKIRVVTADELKSPNRCGFFAVFDLAPSEDK